MPDPIEFLGEEELLPGQKWHVYRNGRTGQVTKVPAEIMKDPKTGPMYLNHMAGYAPSEAPGVGSPDKEGYEGQLAREGEAAYRRWMSTPGPSFSRSPHQDDAFIAGVRDNARLAVDMLAEPVRQALPAAEKVANTIAPGVADRRKLDELLASLRRR